MKATLATVLLGLLLLSVAAWRDQPPAPPPGVTKLVWVSDDNPLRREQVRLFNRLNQDLEVSLDPNNGGNEKVIVQSIAGVGPDLFDCFNGADLDAYYRAGIALDVTDRLADHGIDIRQGFWPAILPTSIGPDGRVYGVPTNVGHNGIWFHKEIFEADGVPFPKTPWSTEEFIEVAKKLTKRDSTGRVVRYGFLIDYWGWRAFMPAFGASLYSRDRTRCTIDSPESIACLRFVHALMHVHRVSPTPTEESTMSAQGGWGMGSMTLFGARRGAMALGGRWWLATYRGRQDLQLGAAEPPFERFRAWTSAGRTTMINKNSPNREKAVRWLLFLAGQEYNQLINDQADGLAAVKRYCEGPRFLLNPRFPEEDHNAVWREVSARAVPEATSPFVNQRLANRLIDVQVDLLRTNQKPIEKALRDAARQVDAAIAQNLEKDPELRRKYERAQRGEEPVPVDEQAFELVRQMP
ncbi:MAG TPA: extracellular solute-binding protein [Fimbriimonas sp.]